VYVRGFVTELAKYLRLDPAQVQRTYLRRMREKNAS
jgi:flagellar biosynthesis protein FlhG